MASPKVEQITLPVTEDETGRKVVAFPLEEYQRTVTRLAKAENKAKSLSGIYNLIADLENEVKRYQERCHNAEAALLQAQKCIANLTRINGQEAHISGVSPSSLKYYGSSNVGRPFHKVHPFNVNNQTSGNVVDSVPMRAPIGADGRSGIGLKADGDSIEADSCLPATKPPRTPETFPSQSAAQSRPNPLTVASLPSLVPGAVIPTTVDNMSLAFSAMSFEPSASGPGPGISQQVFTQLLQENAKLKQEIETLLQQRGMDLNSFMDLQEHKLVIQQLQLELHAYKTKVDELQWLISMTHRSNVDAVANKCADLLNKEAKLQKQLMVRQACLDSYMEQFEALKLKLKLAETGKPPLSAEQHLSESRPSKQASDPTSTSNMTPPRDLLALVEECQREISTLQSKLRKEQQEKELLQEKFEEVSETLQNVLQTRQQNDPYPLSMAELRRDKERLEQEVKLLRRDMANSQEERDVIKAQLKIFQDDFEKEKADRMEEKKKYGKTLSQYEVHIRKFSDEVRQVSKQREEEKKRREKAELKCHQLELFHGVGQPVSCSQTGGSAVTQIPIRFPIEVDSQSQKPRPFDPDSGFGTGGTGKSFDSHTSSSQAPSSKPSSLTKPKTISEAPPSRSMESGLGSSYGSASTSYGSASTKGAKYLECPRCLVEFKPSEKVEFKEHTDRCLDC